MPLVGERLFGVRARTALPLVAAALWLLFAFNLGSLPLTDPDNDAAPRGRLYCLTDARAKRGDELRDALGPVRSGGAARRHIERKESGPTGNRTAPRT
jgi:hypothetical protein